MKCEKCKAETLSLVIHGSDLWCRPCHNETKGTTNRATAIIPDSIVGGVMIKHGICNEDGSPKRYDSKSDIRKAAWEAGYFQGDDTPKTNHRLAEARIESFEQKAKSRRSS